MKLIAQRSLIRVGAGCGAHATATPLRLRRRTARFQG